MRKLIFITLSLCLFLSTNIQAQSWKDIFNSDNVGKVVDILTGNSTSSIVGTWEYTGAAVEFESDNLLKKAGGAVASSSLESKLNEQLKKVGLTSGSTTYTFEADSTFTSVTKKRTSSGTYSYNKSGEKLTLKYSALVNLNMNVTVSSTSLELLFDADKLLQLITVIGGTTSNSTLKAISALAESYDGMKIGLKFTKKKE